MKGPIVELAPGLHRIGSDIVNAYMVEDERGVTLIDAGIPGQWHDLTAELAGMKRNLEDIRGVVLTHGDTDHRGFAERLRRDHGVPVYIHQDDVLLVQGQAEKKAPWGKIKVRPLLTFLWYAARRGGLRVPPVADVHPVEDGATLDLPGHPQIISVPGHSPGSVAVYVPAVDAIFVGDAMTTRHVLTGAKGPQPAPFTLDPARAIESLGRLESLEANWVLPGHGPPWSGGVAAALRQVREIAADRK